jgi:hypothetical protein
MSKSKNLPTAMLKHTCPYVNSAERIKCLQKHFICFDANEKCGFLPERGVKKRIASKKLQRRASFKPVLPATFG